MSVARTRARPASSGHFARLRVTQSSSPRFAPLFSPCARAQTASRRGGSWFSVLTVAQVAVLAALGSAFAYGAYAVLVLFGRQRNASPGTEVCDRGL